MLGVMNHFAHYVRRVVALPNYSDPQDPYFSLPIAANEAFSRPVYHAVPGRGGLASTVRPGDFIWLFSQLSAPWGRLPPSLDAVVRVNRISYSDATYYFGASRSSRWYPLVDATSLLSSKRLLVGTSGSVPALGTSHRHVGQALRHMRRVADVHAIEAHARRALELPMTFISYRLIDGTEQAYRRAARELADGRAVFWDRWSLPRRLAERREFTSDAALDRAIRLAIDRSKRVVGICSPLYAEPGSYSRREFARAKRQGKFEVHRQEGSSHGQPDPLQHLPPQAGYLER